MAFRSKALSALAVVTLASPGRRAPRTLTRRFTRSVVIAAVVASLPSGCGGHGEHATWPVSSGDLAGTRSASESTINSHNVGRLRVRWRFPFTAKPSLSGIFGSTPVVDRDTVYVQDLRSNVFPLNRSTGPVRW